MNRLEGRRHGIGVNSLWPRTAIATAALQMPNTKARSSTMRIAGESPDVTASSIRSVASTEDILVRTPGGWRFKERRIVEGK